jgi:tRNA A37 threonylcarbamoyladenosine dehydratase
MKKLLLLVGIGLGFIAGSKAGRAPYERLEEKIRQVSGRPEVKQVVDAASDTVEAVTDHAVKAATDKVADVSDKVSAKVSSITSPPPENS